MKTRFALLLLLLALVPAAVHAQSFSANLAGANEVPGPGDPDGTGLAVITITGTTVRYTIFVQNIAAPTMAHIHRGGAGVMGDIVVGFTMPFSGEGVNGEVTGVNQTLINEIVANPAGFYVNVHNAEFPAGAVRGQLTGAPAQDGARTLFLPVVGKVAGAAGTNFVSDLRIINQTGSTANVTLDFFASSAAGQSAPTSTRTLTVGPGAQAVLNDVIATLPGAGGLGGLRITSDQNISVIGRVINDLRGSNQGTTGFAVEATELAGAGTAGTLGFLSQASDSDIGSGVGFRTNIGYFNPNPTPATVTFTARRSSDGAVLGSSTVTVPGFSQVQQGAFSLISSVPGADRIQADFYVTWTSTAPVFVYAAVNDNRTGDPVLVQ
ncbi:MAG TPA: CHRD domain-containing protein [Thermoanaerobaculia bacterium]|nr:CHRD domain-containing protein [Thermoanaerobaculia bacterium]